MTTFLSFTTWVWQGRHEVVGRPLYELPTIHSELSLNTTLSGILPLGWQRRSATNGQYEGSKLCRIPVVSPGSYT